MLLSKLSKGCSSAPLTPPLHSPSPYSSFTRIRILLAFYSMKMRASASAAATETPAQLARPAQTPRIPTRAPSRHSFFCNFLST